MPQRASLFWVAKEVENGITVVAVEGKIISKSAQPVGVPRLGFAAHAMHKGARSMFGPSLPSAASCRRERVSTFPASSSRLPTRRT